MCMAHIDHPLKLVGEQDEGGFRESTRPIYPLWEIPYLVDEIPYQDVCHVDILFVHSVAVFGSSQVFNLFSTIFHFHFVEKVRERSLERTTPSMIFVCMFMVMLRVMLSVTVSQAQGENKRMERAKRPRSKKGVRNTIRKSCIKIARGQQVRRA